MSFRNLVLAVALALAACSRPPPDATPEGALRMWIDRMDDEGSPSQAKEAYALLGPAARANLQERASRASLAQGRRVEPWEMLAQGRFGLKFRPKAMRATVTGDTASVEIEGDDPTVDHATVRCAREGAVWRVEPDLPPLPALQRRPGTEDQ